MLAAVMSSSKVQTAAVKVIASELSHGLNANLDVAKVDYKHLNKITLDSVYLSDQKGDTLAYIQHVDAKFNPFGFLKKNICFSRVELDDVVADIHQLDNGEMNYQFLVTAFKPEQKKEFAGMVSIENVWLNGARIRINDWQIDTLNTKLGLNYLSSDSINAEIVSLYARERQGFEINDFSSNVILDSTKASMPHLKMSMPNSHLALSNLIICDDSISGHIDEGHVVLRDIGRLVPTVKNICRPIDVTGSLSGRKDSIHANNLSLSYNGTKLLQGNILLVDTTHIDANLTDLYLNSALVQDFVSDLKGKPFQAPEVLNQLGNIHYKGRVTGSTDSLLLQGNLSTRLGNLRTDGTLQTNEEELTFRGILSTKHFNIGSLAGVKDLGSIAMRLQVDGHANGEDHPLHGDIDGQVYSLDYKGYTYENAHIKGFYRHRNFQGKLNMRDENVAFDFDGLVDMTRKLPVYDFKLNVHKLCLGTINLLPQYPESDLRFSTDINMTGSNLDNMSGSLNIDTLTFVNGNKKMDMQQLHADIETDSIFLRSDYVDLDIYGDYAYSTLGTTIKKLVAVYVPKLWSTEELCELFAQPSDNELYMNLRIKNDINEVPKALGIDLEVNGSPHLTGVIDEKHHRLNVNGDVDKIRYNKNIFKDLAVEMNNDNNQANLNIDVIKQAGEKSIGKIMGDLALNLHAAARFDSLYLDFSWKNNSEMHNIGKIKTRTHFGQYANKAMIDMNIIPTEMILNDSVWYVGNSHLIFTKADTTLEIRNFRFANSEQSIFANGSVSKREEDSLYVYLEDIDLDYLLDYTNVKKAISFTGAVTGWAKLYSLFSQPMFEADVEMMKAHINNALVGDVYAKATLDRENKTINIFGDIIENTDSVAHVDGKVVPKEKKWDIFVHTDSTNLAFINYWTGSIFDNINGRAFGDIHVFGKEKSVWVEGKAFAQDASLTIPVIGTTYYFSDTITMDTSNIYFREMTLYDKEHNPIHLNGGLHHNRFNDFSYDMTIDVEHALGLQLPANPQDMFYGTVYATGKVKIFGNEEACTVDVNARTDKKTDFVLSLAKASNAHDNSFITFVNHQASIDTIVNIKPAEKRGAKISLGLQVEATPDAQVSLIIDNKSGDQLKGRGAGNLKISYDNFSGDCSVFGTYTLQEGTFYFTLQNVIRKDFKIQNGSKITFTGDPTNPQADAAATYSTTASLRDLFGSDYANVSTNRTSVPVTCILYLKDNIMNPTISFGIELPNSDESVASQVKSIINTDEMLMRQIIYLLVFNRFYTPEYLQTNTSSIGINETYSLLSSTVTGQINSWINKLTTDLSVGFNIRTDGEGSDASQEYETQFQYQHNNRLLINGNFGYRYNDISNQPVFGNLDVEYILSKNGHWRAKAYTHTVDKYSIREAHTQQGVGFKYQTDFNFSDIKTKREQKKKK